MSAIDAAVLALHYQNDVLHPEGKIRVGLDADGAVQKEARFDTTMPQDARRSVYESSLTAALNANMSDLKNWFEAK